MNITFFGATKTVTGSNFLLEGAGKKILIDWLERETQVNCVIPKAGTTAFVRYNLPVKSEELCVKLQEETGVMILPGAAMECEGYLRIGYGNNFDKLQKGLEIFSDWLQRQG